MLKNIFIIFFFQLIGEIIQKYFNLPFPGPIIGLILILILLLTVKRLGFFTNTVDDVTKTAEQLISYLPLLFVPIGVGVIIHLSFIETDLILVLAVIFLSTVATIGFTAFVMEKLTLLLKKRHDQ